MTRKPIFPIEALNLKPSFASGGKPNYVTKASYRMKMGSEGRKSKKRRSLSSSSEDDDGKGRTEKKHKSSSSISKKDKEKKSKKASHRNSSKYSDDSSKKGKKSEEKHDRKRHTRSDHLELTQEDYFLKNNEFATWLKEKRGLFFSDLSSEAARELFLKFIKAWNNDKLESRYYEGITTGPRTAHNWKISNTGGL